MKPSLVIAGLGNPGREYEGTRHNLGFDALDVLADEWGEGEWQEKPKFSSLLCEARLLTMPVLLLKPLLFMNRSGEPLRKLIDFYTLDPASQLLVMCDDIDLPLGELRFREKGGAGTHNGLKSIIAQFGEEFPRLRIGLGTPQHGEDLAAWVLSKTSVEERDVLKKSIAGIPDAIRENVL